MALESTGVAPGSAESRAVEAAKKEIKKKYGVDVTDKWISLVDYFEDGETKDAGPVPIYHMVFYQLGVGYGDRYDVTLKAEDMSLLMLNKSSFDG